MIKLKRKFKPLYSASLELGITNIIVFVASFIIILKFEIAKLQSPQSVTIEWIIISVLTYTIFASYFGYFFTYLLPRNYKKEAIMFYLQRRASDIAISISYIIMDLISKSNSGDENNRNRSVEELKQMCLKINSYQKFPSHFERNEPYLDFFEYFSFNSNRMNGIIEKLLSYSDVLTEHQVKLLLEMEKDTDSQLTSNIKFSNGMIDGNPATSFIPDAYASVIDRLRKNSQSLLISLGIGNSVL